ncbi:MAG: aldolase/citrate lyase family protein [Rhizobiaceae bacterium]|nr:aldolase/citrate lyase family protein [Rhizobiaceae bacterium]
MSATNDSGPAALRDRLNSDGSLGTWVSLPSAEVAEIFAHCGFDWLLLDLQHGLSDRSSILNMIRALDAAGVPAIVRAPQNNSELLGWALDAGAAGVMAPLVGTPEQLRTVVSLCTYAPSGTRSWGPIRATMRGRGFPDDKDRPVVSMMLETREGVDNLESILEVDGLDMVFVGQSDLALDYGLKPGDGIRDPAHVARLQRIAKLCKDRGISCAVNCHGAQQLGLLRGFGYRHVTLLGDATIIRTAALELVASVRAVAGKA